jgi:hypothetical protein
MKKLDQNSWSHGRDSNRPPPEYARIEDCRLVGCGDVWVYYKPTFRKNVSPQHRLVFFFARVISSTLKLEATRSSEMSVYNKPTRRHIAEDGILHSHRRESSNPT